MEGCAVASRLGSEAGPVTLPPRGRTVTRGRRRYGAGRAGGSDVCSIIKGTTKDAAGVRRQGERWNTDVRPGAIGFLGSTVGVSEGGTFFAIARFADAASARANWSDRSRARGGRRRRSCSRGSPPSARRVTSRRSSTAAPTLQGSCRSWKAPSTDRAKAEALENDELLAQLHAARPDLHRVGAHVARRRRIRRGRVLHE